MLQMLLQMRTFGPIISSNTHIYNISGRGGQIRTADLLVPNQAPCHWATPRCFCPGAKLSLGIIRNPPNLPFSDGQPRGIYRESRVVPPERVELSSPAPEAGTLSTELRGPVTSLEYHGSDTVTRLQIIGYGAEPVMKDPPAHPERTGSARSKAPCTSCPTDWGDPLEKE